jgi:hypothetical protein
VREHTVQRARDAAEIEEAAELFFRGAGSMRGLLLVG